MGRFTRNKPSLAPSCMSQVLIELLACARHARCWGRGSAPGLVHASPDARGSSRCMSATLPDGSVVVVHWTLSELSFFARTAIKEMSTQWTLEGGWGCVLCSRRGKGGSSSRPCQLPHGAGVGGDPPPLVSTCTGQRHGAHLTSYSSLGIQRLCISMCVFHTFLCTQGFLLCVFFFP